MRKVLLGAVLAYALLGIMALTPSSPAQFTYRQYGQPLKTACTLDSHVQPIGVLILPPAEIQKLYEKQGGTAKVRGFQTELKEMPDAKILVVPPLRGQRDNERLLTWGHELAHAVCGIWHGPRGPE